MCGERLRLLRDDVHLDVDVKRVVGADLGAEAVLERRDDAAAVRVVLGVGRRHQHQVEGQADLVAADLHVALLEHVQQTDLDALGEVGQLVDGEDPAVRARDEPVVDGELVGEVAAFGDLDRVDLADEVGDRSVGGGELLTETPFAVDPLDRSVLATLGRHQPGVLRHRCIRVVVDLAPGDRRRPLVEQADERTDDARLRLAALTEEDDVVAGEQGVLELRQHRVVEADHPVDERLARRDAGQGVRPDLLLDRPRLPPARS